MRVLSFDMGIRNLAFCLLDNSGNNYHIIAWDNYDLTTGTDSQSSTRCACGGPASWVGLNEILKCKKCVKKESLICLPKDTELNVSSLKILAKKEGWNLNSKAKKDDYINEVKQRYLTPYKKQKSSAKVSLLSILDSINGFLNFYMDIFTQAELIRIENQPVFDNPTMKSVQIILFTLLTHRLRVEKKWKGDICFVHASKKTEEDKDAIDTYKGRKDAAENLVLGKLKDGKWREFFLSKQKKSDLADAFLMSARLDK
jgi:hypothetical protein